MSKQIGAKFARAVPVLCGALLATTEAPAEPVVNRALSDVQLIEREACAIIRIGFNFRVRYKSHFPLARGTDLRIATVPIDPAVAASLKLLRREALRPPLLRQAAIREIELEVNRAEGTTLHINFKTPVNFRVASGRDFTSVVIAVFRRKDAPSCLPVWPGRAAAPWITTIEGETFPGAAPRKRSPARGRKLSTAEKKKVAKTMRAARAALKGKKYRAAIRLLTKVLTYPENTHSPFALELLGLARQRNKQLAHAKAEYEAYLRKYPDGAGAARVRQRLAGLLTARGAGKSKLRKARRKAGGGGKDGDRWSVSGSLSHFYYRDDTFRTVRDPSLPPDPNPDEHDIYQNSMLTGFDLIAKFANGVHKSKFRFSGTYEHSFLDGSQENWSVSSLYFQTAILDWSVLGKFGRQTRNTGGVVGRFDGGLLSWQASKWVQLNVVAGSPVERKADSPFENDKYFYGVSADFTKITEGLDATLFFLEQRADDYLDRRAIGLEARYLDEAKSAFLTVDYDTHFNRLNTAIFSGTWKFQDDSTLSLSADYRKSPYLLYSNALIGQPLESIRALLGVYSEDELRRLALDRTATSRSATLGYSRPLAKWLTLNLDLTWSNISATPESGGVPEARSTGDEWFYSARLIGTNIVKQGDTFTVGLRYSDRATADYYLLDLNARLPVMRKLRLSPRIKVGYQENKFDDYTRLTLFPSLRANYFWTRDLSFEVEVGGQWSYVERGTLSERGRDFYLIAGVRYSFYEDESSKDGVLRRLSP